MSVFPLLLMLCSSMAVISPAKFFIDERWICSVKRTCLDCLQLPHCSWCGSENKCFSDKLPMFKEFCQNNTVHHEDFGLSLEDNAECSCAGGKMDLRCYPPGVAEGPECSGRGECVCGHCVCDPNPVPENPTKIIMGEYCEYDNFSCDGPKCNEGPYSLSQPMMTDDDD